MRILHAIVYIDWGAAQRIAAYSFKHRSRSEENLIVEALDQLDAKLSEILKKKYKDQVIRVKRRVYNGWHQGETKSDQRQCFEKVEALLRDHPKKFGKISFDPELGWGDQLLCGGKRSFIKDTLGRAADRTQKVQKMVDMCLGVDLLIATRQTMADLHLLVCDDDDIWPAVVASIEWGAKVKIVRITRTHENKHLDTSGIIWS